MEDLVSRSTSSKKNFRHASNLFIDAFVHVAKLRNENSSNRKLECRNGPELRKIRAFYKTDGPELRKTRAFYKTVGPELRKTRAFYKTDGPELRKIRAFYKTDGPELRKTRAFYRKTIGKP
jgi:hypothetical protein